MQRYRLIRHPARINLLLEKQLKRESRAFGMAQGFNSHNDYLTRLMIGDLTRKRSLALNRSRRLPKPL